MISFIGKVIGAIFELTENLRFTIVIVAAIMFVSRMLINAITKKQGTLKLNMNKIMSIQQSDINSIEDEALNEIKQINLLKVFLSYALKFIYYTLSLFTFLVIINATQYIPGVKENCIYSFLFIPDIMEKSHNVLLPITCSLLIFFSQNIFVLKHAVIDKFAKNAFRLAMMILMFSIYVSWFGQIYLIYIMTQQLLTSIVIISKFIIEKIKK